MKKTIFLSFLMLFIASPLVNAYTFKKYEGKKTYSCNDLGEKAYESFYYNIQFPTDGPNALKKAILKNAFDYNGTSITAGIQKFTTDFLNTKIRHKLVSSNINYDAPNYTYGPLGYSDAYGEVKSQTSELITYIVHRQRYYHSHKVIHYYIPGNKVLKTSDLFLSSKTTTINKLIQSKTIYELRLSDCEYFTFENNGILLGFYAEAEGGRMNPFIEITIPKYQLDGCLTALGEKFIKGEGKTKTKSRNKPSVVNSYK